MTLRKQCTFVFVAGFAVRVALIFGTYEYRDVTRYELQRTAFSLANSGVYGNPYLIPTGPTAHVSPGYPLILAGIYRLFGAETTGEIVKELLASAVSSLGWALVPAVGAVLGLPALAGIAAGVIGALLPLKLSVETKGDWEAPYSALAVMFVVCVTAGIWRKGRFSSREAVLSGVGWGVSLLFVSALLPLLIVFWIVSWKHVRFVLIQLAIVALLLSPWAIRNQIALGSPIFTRSNAGLELRLSNNNMAGPLERKNFVRGLYYVYHPLQSQRQAEQVRDLGEVEYNRLAVHEALAWMQAHPARFVSLTAQRVLYFWFQPIPGQNFKAIWLGIVALLGFVGLGLLWRRQQQVALVLTLLMVVFPLPNYLVHVGLRHRYPLDWLCTLLAAYAICVALGRGSLVFPRHDV